MSTNSDEHYMGRARVTSTTINGYDGENNIKDLRNTYNVNMDNHANFRGLRIDNSNQNSVSG